jgi:hypothetical protein
LARPASGGGQPDADLALGTDADRLVAEPLARLAVSGEKPAPGFPLLPPLGLADLRILKMVSGVQQAFAAAYHTHPARFAVGADLVESVLKNVQAARFVEPLVRRAVAARSPLGAFLADRQRQPGLDGFDTGFERLDVRRLAAPGECPLIMCGFRDAARPPGRRGGGQLPLTGRPRVRRMLKAVSAARAS